MAVLDGIKKILKMCGHAFTLTVHDRLETMEQRQAETDNVILRASIQLAEQVRRGGRYEVISSASPADFYPALALARHLYPLFPSPAARSIGCDSDDSPWNSELARIGYVLNLVDAGSQNLALLRICGVADLSAVTLSASRPSVVIADLGAASEDRVNAMRAMDYRWYLVLEHPQEAAAAKFYVNCPIILPQWRGEVMFFRDHSTFLYALRWCEAVLRQVYFSPPENLE